jgi:hypothetical protein
MPIAAEVEARNCLRFTPDCFFIDLPSLQTAMREIAE